MDLQIIMLRSRVMARFAYLECHCSLFRTVVSETCPCSVATLLSSHQPALLSFTQNLFCEAKVLHTCLKREEAPGNPPSTMVVWSDVFCKAKTCRSLYATEFRHPDHRRRR